MTPEEKQFAESLRKAYVSLIAAESYITRSSFSAAVTHDDSDRLKDIWHLAEIAARDCLRILEEKDLLLGTEED